MAAIVTSVYLLGNSWNWYIGAGYKLVEFFPDADVFKYSNNKPKITKLFWLFVSLLVSLSDDVNTITGAMTRTLKTCCCTWPGVERIKLTAPLQGWSQILTAQKGKEKKGEKWTYVKSKQVFLPDRSKSSQKAFRTGAATKQTRGLPDFTNGVRPSSKCCFLLFLQTATCLLLSPIGSTEKCCLSKL